MADWWAPAVGYQFPVVTHGQSIIRPMKTFRAGERMLSTSVLAIGIGLAVAATASADPDVADPVPAPVPGPGIAPPGPPPELPVADPMAVDGDPAVSACSQFAAALDHASSYYSDFADSLADPSMGADWNTSTNVTGRTALRQAASAAMSASSTPGLQPDISAPMQSWSVNATKLLVLMGVRAPVDPVNGKANDLNNDATNVQMACAAAGTRA
jgi:hypothetical protein